jgi:predicted ribosome quality control (RQC) complex YloA/Tae2 family protein
LIWDPVLVASLARELRTRLTGARLRALHMDSVGQRVILFFREATLVAHLAPHEAGLVLEGPSEPIPLSRAFASAVVGVHAPPDDRVLELELRLARSREPRRIVLELLTNQVNVLVLQGEEGRIRHALVRRDGAPAPEGRGSRALRPGLVYDPPPRSRREGADGSLSLDRWLALLAPSAPEARRRTLLASVAWTSALNAGALLGAAAREDGPAAQRALEDGYALWLELMEVAREGGPRAAAVLMRRGDVLQPYPMMLTGEPSEPMPDLLAAFAAAAAARGREGVAQVPGGWLDALAGKLDRARARARKLARELEEAPNPEAMRAIGDLLLARYRDVPKNAARVKLADFAGGEVEVELDPARSTHENAAAYYERAARAARARERLPALIEAADRDLRALLALLERARAGQATADEVLRVLPSESAPTTARIPALPYRRYTSSGGLEIRVGKGAKQNDALTFKHSSPEDVWLHARHAAGAHVVLRWQEEGTPPARDLMEAATLAALHSRARTSAAVPVDWTRRKHVRKPRKAPPGTVVIERARTLFVEPDAELEERLRSEPEE